MQQQLESSSNILGKWTQ